MPVKVIAAGLGQSMPPEGLHTVTVHLPGWETACAFRKGDKTIFAALKSMYPRFGPFNKVRQLAAAILSRLALPALPAGEQGPTYSCLPFVSPDAFAVAAAYAASRHRKDDHTKLLQGELLFRVVDIADVRLYLVVFPAAKAPGIIGIWQNPGVGVSSRLAEMLLAHIDTLAVLPFEASSGDGDMPSLVRNGALPPPTYLPEEGEGHEKLRQRIMALLKRAPVKKTVAVAAVSSGDVYLCPTGMAAIYRLHGAALAARRGPVVALGAVFHSTWQLFSEEPAGFKHFGRCDAEGRVMEQLEAYLEAEAAAGRAVSYVFAEFPSNPILVSVDLWRLRELADKYGFAVVVDETVGSFCNIDVLPVADVVVTSLTKSFSGYANVMGGSIVLNPASAHYRAVQDTLTKTFHNEYFSGDAAHLLQCSDDYLARSTILNGNALLLTRFLATCLTEPTPSPVTAVLYPPFTDTAANYTSLMRPATTTTTLATTGTGNNEFEPFEPGFGCLFSIDFVNKACARAFYDNLAVYHGPHLGAHHTLAFPFNDAIWGGGGDPDPSFAYHVAYGLRPEQVRVSVGLESEEELLDTFKAALACAEEELRRQTAAEAAQEEPVL
ncbi:pyridoxal phosphate-dependent transferase [Lasiosphaeria miniovina]|uniref:Pyridoxal phosphate-dependent transferase n=1 Tax=Lasiosphaeria miniovina TaxID=1954250 RepID=A0AA40ED48_9PEZI|nr:pyridoxal phosphate-dependent transferase [Lasiosphaeria miniovina]KAK0733957.1 pyridoxal phosphate-dependent transferase [Lasiosphaeria miniovina]